jgi:hypothetical protein
MLENQLGVSLILVQNSSVATRVEEEIPKDNFQGNF